MFKKILLVLTAIVFLFTTVSISLALEKGNKRKGKYSYRKVYKACFDRGAVQSQTPPISPADKTQAEWETIFSGNDYAQFGCQEEWNSLDETQVADIYAYLYEHASDSPTPAKCK